MTVNPVLNDCRQLVSGQMYPQNLSWMFNNLSAVFK